MALHSNLLHDLCPEVLCDYAHILSSFALINFASDLAAVKKIHVFNHVVVSAENGTNHIHTVTPTKLCSEFGFKKKTYNYITIKKKYCYVMIL